MKLHLLLCLSSLLALFSSCQDRQVRTELNAIENTLHAHPDSALMAIRQIPSSRIHSPAQKARHALLSSLAMDKCYIDIADDSIARVAVQYYSRSKDRRRSMLAWYSLGRVQMNAENPGGAIISLKQAEKEALEADDHHYLGLIYYNIGNLYGSQDDAEEALGNFDRSASHFLLANEPNNAAYSQYCMALGLFALNRYAACDSLLISLEQYAETYSDRYLASQLHLAKGSFALLKDKNNAADAKAMIHSGMDRNNGMRSQDLCYLMMACAYLEQRDSSDYYRALALQNARTSRDSAQVYSAIYKVESYWKHFEEALHYQDLSWKITNRRMSRRESMLISNSLADYHKAEATEAIERSRRQRSTMIVSAMALLLFILFLIQRLQLRSIQGREKDRIISEQKARLQEDMENTGEILTALKALQAENSEALSALFSSVLSQMEMVSKWAETYNAISKESDDPYRKMDADFYKRKDDAIREFYSSLDGIRNNDKWFSQVEYMLNKSHDGIMLRAREACFQPGKKRQVMDESDYRTLLLMIIGLPDKATAYFLGLSYGSIRMRRSRFKELFSQMGAPDGPVLSEALSHARNKAISIE